MAVKKKPLKKTVASSRAAAAGKKTTAAKKPAVKGKTTKSATTSVRRKSSAATKAIPAKTARGKKTAPVRKKGERAAKVEQDNRLLEVKKTILAKKESIVKEAKAEIAKYMSGENRQLVDTALDEGDWAVVDISEDINLMRLGAHRKALHDIDEVLRKIHEGSYGICEECGEEISEKRLKVIPTAALCIKCQGTKEQLEAIEREEEV